MGQVLLVLAAVAAASSGTEGLDPSFLDFDLDSLNYLARSAYNEERWGDAAALYVEYLRHDPSNSGEIYNAACCFGLMGEDTLAIRYLVAAVRAGFSDPGFAAVDPDFDGVRDSGVFEAGLDSLLAVFEEREARRGSLVFVETPALVPVRVLLPGGMDPGTPVPLLVGLHGYGSSAERFTGLYQRLDDPGFIYAVPESPYPMSGGREIGYSWNTWSAADSTVAAGSWDSSIALVRAVVERMTESYPVSSAWLLGFSQGCALAYGAGLRNPDLVDGMICFGGWLDTTGIPAAGLELAAASQHVFIAHGILDRMVEPEAGREAFSLLSGLGFDVVLREFEGSHTVAEGTLGEAVDWMTERDAGL